MAMLILELILSKLVDKTVDKSQSDLECMKNFELNLKKLHKKLKTLIAKASDVEEEIKNAVLSGRKKRKREVEEWLGEVRSIETEVAELGRQVESEGFITRLMDGGTPARLIDDVDELVEQSRNFGELVLDVCGTSGETLLTNGLVGDAFNKNLERILKLLESGEVSSIGVYGMGGVGKTTLAKHIHNRLLQQSQGHVFWITVSQDFTVTSLQDKIARQLGVDLSDEDNEDIRGARLQRALSQMKNSVLILDDVWENIDPLKVGCRFSVECCRLIITTRSLEVCRQIQCKKMILVKKLGEDEAWKLFDETLGHEIQLGPQMEEIAKSMAKLCDGLPLGIITMAGSMRGETSIYTWKNALEELKERVLGQDAMGNDEVYKVLKYSFDRLNRNHQSRWNEFNTFQLCFLYCSLYPEDHKIPREDLVRSFISGRLVDERKSRRAQVEQGHSIVNKLVNVCLLESCSIYKRIECVKIHDLVRGMALKISEGKYMVRSGEYPLEEILDEEEWTKDLEKVSLMGRGIRRIEYGISPNCPKLSTLLLHENPLEVIPGSFFSKLQGLCTLDLYGTYIRKLPDLICDMKSLKALLLENCEKLEKVPYLGGLKALRELNLSGTAIKEVPQGVEELFNLKFLSMVAYGLKMFPAGLLLRLVHLQHLNFPLHIQVPIEEMENLKQLEELNGGMKNVNDFNCFITSMGQDTCYRIVVRSRDTTRYSEEEEKEEEFRFYENELLLCECNLKDEKVLLQGVVYLTMRECEGPRICFLDDLSGLNNPTSLKRLKISDCGGIEFILRSEQGFPSQILKTLEEIELRELEYLKGLIQKGEIGAPAAPAQPVFSSLTKLTIYDCDEMKKLGLPVLEVPNLEEIEIRECEQMEEIFEEEGRGSVTLSKLRCLWLDDLPRLRKVGLSVLGVPNLEVIEIAKCGKIEEIFEDEGRDSVNLPKLIQLNLRGLPRLRKVGLPVLGAPNLVIIYISECGEVEEIFEDEGRGSLTLPKLKTLSLHELPKLRKVGLPVLAVPNLELIHIHQYGGEIEEIFEDEGSGFITLPKLKHLSFNWLPRLKNVCKEPMICNSIDTIYIRKCPRLMKKLPLHFDDPPPPTLTWINVEREWWESLEWDNPDLPQLLHHFLYFGE